MVSAGIPCSREPLGLSRSDGKRPSGLSLVPWVAGKPMTWDVTVICLLANSFIASAAHEAGSAAEEAEIFRHPGNHIFQPVAIESLGPINASGCTAFFSKLGCKLADQLGDNREIRFLFQRLSVLIQRYNAILLYDSFMKDEVHCSLIFVLFCNCIVQFFHSLGIEFWGQIIIIITVTQIINKFLSDCNIVTSEEVKFTPQHVSPPI